jgi:DNA-binding response OmpR family regulator
MKTATVLCIEDEEDFRSSLVDFLKAEGYNVMEAADGKQGLQLITERQPQLVLCDVSMPEMSGFQLLTELRAFHPDHAGVPFIFLTALNQKKNLMTGRLLGADDYMVKPVDFDMLAVTIKAKLDQAERQKRHIDSEVSVFKSLLLQILAYEIRAPINAVIGQSELLRERMRDSKIDETYQRMSGKLHDLGHELLSMLNNAVDALALTNGLVSMQEQPVDIETLLWECVQSVTASAMCEGIRISQSIESGMPMLRADPWLLSRMLLVLLLDAARSRLSTSEVTLDAHLSPEKELIIAITDAKATLNEAYHDISPVMWEAEGGGMMPYPKSISLQFVKAVMTAHQGTAAIMQTHDTFGGVVLRFPVERLVG